MSRRQRHALSPKRPKVQVELDGMWYPVEACNAGFLAWEHQEEDLLAAELVAEAEKKIAEQQEEVEKLLY